MAKLTTEQLKSIMKEKYRIQEERNYKTVLTNICTECNRYRKIPIHFCNECWVEMDQTINK